ncbi:MAG: T9SS type A sorting domain-containing protein, partial [Chitinophagales bacterium]|nr:T9SS type A sorting domain-containing protein [Chitinophagales bacterium]
IKLRNNATKTTQTFTSTTNVFTATGLTPCTSYKFRVKAKCSATNTFTAFSSWYNFSTGGTTCRTEMLAGIPAWQEGLICYPNPADDLLNVRMKADDEQKAQLYLIDGAGRIVHEQALILKAGSNLLQLDLSPFPPGLYFIRLIGDETVLTHRITISR